MAYISKLVRDLVTRRAKGRCEYCQTAQAIVIEMVIDHVVPETAGGQTVIDNLCLACVSCNTYKRDFQEGIDPTTGQTAALYHPRTMSWSEHFDWDADGTQLLGLTPMGRATINRLRMNREALIQARKRWVEAGWHPPTD